MRMIVAALLGLLAAGCLFDTAGPRAGGGSSETTNGVVVGYVLGPGGAPAANARITLRPRSFLKDPASMKAGKADKPGRKLAQVYADAAGRYAIDSVEPGDYWIEAADTGRLGALLEFSSGDRDTHHLETRVLAPTGTIRGSVAAGSAAGAYVQIYGLDRVARAGADGAFAFGDLPAGRYTLRAALGASAVDPRELPGVVAASADTTDVGAIPLTASFADEDYAAWPFRRRMILNTTPSGADVPRDISDFPVLVRLDRANFDFARSDGKDLRFSDTRGKRLRYHVERWDPVGQRAEVWVKVDTVQGNSRADHITMHWGRPGAPDWSDSRQVFDTASAFGGVWHLSEEAADTVSNGLYADATAAAQHGDDRNASASAEGVAGRGQGFGMGDHIRIRPGASLRPANYVYVSAWFRGTRTDTSGASIAGLGDSYGLRVEADGNVRMFIFEGAGKGWPLAVTQGLNVLDSAWHHLAGLYSSGFLHVYVDGEEKAKVAVSAGLKVPYTLGKNFYIGRHGNGKRAYDFAGQLDEVVVVNRLRGVNFAKLCFESQRLNPTLLEFEP